MQKLIINADDKSLKLGLHFKELLQYKDLFLTLAYRDFRVRYAQTFLGLVWAILQPVTTLIIFTLVFGRFVKVDTGNVPYPLFALSGMVIWTYFSFVMSQAGSSIIDSQAMVKKIYFPRLIIPLSKAMVGFVDFAVSFAFLIGLMAWYQFTPSGNIIAAPVFILMAIIASLAIGIWLSALTIRYRDFKHIVPFMVQFGLYATPIAYPTSLIDAEYKIFFYLNPLTGIIEGFRWSVLGGNPPNIYSFISFVLIFVLFVTGVLYFKKVERVIADIV